MEDFFIPDYARTAIERLKSAGYKAYLVGGCVRDTLMGKTPGDYDITTSAQPCGTIACFKGFNVIETGLKHGTVTVVIDKKPLEITTFRVDGSYADNRHPDSVSFSSDIADDLARRDFTVNAMAYDPDEGLVDLYGGINDLKKKIIKCVGDAEKRFNEDSLRILRAMRFAAVLGFDIEQKTLFAAHENAHLLKNISAERIYTEFLKTVCAKAPGKILYEFKKEIKVFIPEFGLLDDNALQELFFSIDGAQEDKYVRLSVLFMPFGSETAEKILKRLKTDKFTQKTVCSIIDSCKGLEYDEVFARRLLNRLSFEDALRLCAVECAAYPEKKEQVCVLKNNIELVQKRGDCVNYRDLAVGGNDLKKEKIAEGKRVGEILAYLLDMVLTEPTKNDYNFLIEIAKNL